jgi:hypothetical protein
MDILTHTRFATISNHLIAQQIITQKMDFANNAITLA